MLTGAGECEPGKDHGGQAEDLLAVPVDFASADVVQAFRLARIGCFGG